MAQWVKALAVYACNANTAGQTQEDSQGSLAGQPSRNSELLVPWKAAGGDS